jgi:1-acyl-sn-glycerol-3-phosphate acyltransferase
MKKKHKSRIVIVLLSVWAFAKLIYHSVSVNLRGCNTREITDQRTHEWSQKLFDIMDTKVVVKGKLPEFKPNKCYILVSNHLSLYDIPAIFVAAPNASIRMIAKKELLRVPFFGRAMAKHEIIFIDRKNRQKAIRDLERAKEKMRSGIVMWAAAEGTRSRTGELLPFKKGLFLLAIQSQATVIPVTIQGTERMLPARTWNFKPGQTVTVKIGPGIDTDGMSPKKRDVLLEQVRETMQDMLNNDDY